jgi:hypothetical protein
VRIGLDHIVAISKGDPAMALNDTAMSAPIITGSGLTFHPYNCHMAVIHWALVTLGHGDQVAQAAVQKLTGKNCKDCYGLGKCLQRSALDERVYAAIFCKKVTSIGSKPSAQDVELGDVILVPDPKNPMHSMVVVEKSNDDRIGIRGFNNIGTFIGTDAPYARYDSVTRWLDDRTIPEREVYRVKQMDFLFAAQAALIELGSIPDLPEPPTKSKSTSCLIL